MLRYVTGASAFLMATASASAFAQAAQSEPAQTGEVGLSEITVTARKITENRQKAPASITVLESEALTTAGIKVPTDLEKLLPGTSLRLEGDRKSTTSETPVPNAHLVCRLLLEKN